MTNSFYIAPRLTSLLLLSILITGCGEFAYKRGASADDLENSKKSCLAKGGDAAAIDKCMEDSGWVVQKFNEPDPVAEASYNPDNRNITKPVDNTIPSATNTLKTAEVKPGSVAGSSTGSTISGVKDAAPSSTATQAQTPQKSADPLDSFKINSWWKMGSGPEGLKAATEECIGVLGEKHRPDVEAQYVTVTRGLLVCMRDKGWRALRAR